MTFPGGLLILLPPAAWAAVTLSQIPVWFGARGVLQRAVAAGVICAAWLVVITEGLSGWNAVGTVGLAAGWAGLTVAAILLRGPFPAWDGGRDGVPGSADPERHPFVFYAAIGSILGITFLTAVIGAPNNWDSMSYHLPRAMHGLANGNIHHYATANLWQLYYPPFAEWAALHVLALGGSDRFVNLVQWVSFWGCLSAAAVMAQGLGLDGRGRRIAVILCATVPLAVLEASTTQNDLVAAFFLMVFAAGAAGPTGPDRHQGVPAALLTGAALGLAILTKATAYAYALPWLLWWCFRTLKARGTGGLVPLAAAGLTAAAINAGHWWRNIDLFGSPMPLGLIRHSVESASPAALAMNLFKNLATHATTPFPGVNAALQAGVERLHALAGVGMYDPRMNQLLELCCVQPRLVIDEDMTGNLLHAALYLIVLPAGIWQAARERRSRTVLPHLLAALFGILFVCTYLKWQIFNVRYHLPFFLLAAPAAAAWLKDRKPGIVRAILIVLCATALVWPLFCENRPLAGEDTILKRPRPEVYFAKQEDMRESYEALGAWVRKEGVRELGLLINPGEWEYPFWALGGKPGTGIRIEHVDVLNVSARLSDPGFDPPFVVSNRLIGRLPGEAMDRFRQRYPKLRFAGKLYVFSKS